MGTVDVVDGRRMHVESDGSYVITVDAEEPGGRPNHIRSTPEAHELYIRDVLLDWAVDDPNHIEVHRLGGEPTTPALTLDEQAEATARMMAHFADFTGKLSHGMYKAPVNHFSLAWTADHTGAMRNQVYVAGRFLLEPGQAFVVDVSDGGAEYFTVPLSNIWGTTLGIADRTGSLNKAQSAPERRRHLHLRHQRHRPRRPQLGRHRRAARGHPHAADGGVPGRRGPARPEGDGPGGRPRRPRPRAARRASGERCGAGLPARRPEVGLRAPPPRRGPRMSRWFITGCSTGIGREIARCALEAGHQVAVTARRVGDVEDFVTTFGDLALALPLDVTDKAAIDAAVAAATDRFGGIDVLVNNAGYGYLSAVEEGDDADVRRLFDTNYFGVVDTLKAVLPGMRAQGSGHVVNISSMTGLVANPPNAYYSSTKFALEALTEALSKEVGLARHQGDRHRARCVPHRLGEAVDARGLAADRRLRRRRRRPQGPDQAVRRPPARRPAQGRGGRAHGDRAGEAAAAAAARLRRAARRPAPSSPTSRRRSTSGSP